ncbi:MAG: LptA/OstA family protein [Pelagimonas sp.]|jgi:lipopolysaccharide export system protein LptA|nr:LptA/OstA family protein [Pelagimonas sp.]
MIRALFFAVLTIFTPALAMAQMQVAFGNDKQDTDAPVEVTADQLSVDQNAGTALYSGNVLVVQDEMRLAAPRVLVIYSEENSRVERLEATGGVTIVSGDDAAESRRADYHVQKREIVMVGDVLLTQGASALTSQRMVVFMDDGTAQLTGRVKSVLQSSDEPPADEGQ